MSQKVYGIFDLSNSYEGINRRYICTTLDFPNTLVDLLQRLKPGEKYSLPYTIAKGIQVKNDITIDQVVSPNTIENGDTIVNLLKTLFKPRKL